MPKAERIVANDNEPSALTSFVAALGVGIYLIGAAMPVAWPMMDVPLLVLAVCSVWIAFKNQVMIDRTPRSWPHLAVPTFIMISLVNIVFSTNVLISIAVSAVLLPGFLLYFLIANNFRTQKLIWFTLHMLITVSVCLSIQALFAFFLTEKSSFSSNLVNLGTALYSVPNDILLVSILAPPESVTALNAIAPQPAIAIRK